MLMKASALLWHLFSSLTQSVGIHVFQDRNKYIVRSAVTVVAKVRVIYIELAAAQRARPRRVGKVGHAGVVPSSCTVLSSGLFLMNVQRQAATEVVWNVFCEYLCYCLSIGHFLSLKDIVKIH